MLVRGGLLLDPAVTAEIAWALLHFLWQGLVLAALLWMALKIPGQSARTRYLACGATLVLMLLAPAITYWTISGDFDDPGPLKLPPSLALLIEPAEPGADQAELAAFPPQPAVMDGVPTGARVGASPVTFNLPAAWSLRLQQAVPWIVLGWLAVALLLAARQWVSMLVLHRSLKHNTVPMREGNDRLDALPARLGVQRRVLFVECPLLRAPATVGWLQPVVLVPTHALDSLWPRQLDALVAHELAHICRNDYVINIVQMVVESVLAFHPAVWWVSACTREEREACCDELAADVVGSRKEYAAALATMDQLPATLLPASAALSAAGGPLLRRVRRMAMSAPQPFGHRPSRFAPAAVLGPLVTAGVLLIAVSQLIATSVNVSPPRGLHDIGALGATVYDALGIEPPASGGHALGLVPTGDELLTQLRQVLKSTDWSQKQFDEPSLDDLVEVVLHHPHSDVLASVQLPLTDVRARTSHETRPEWRYGSSYQRRQIRLALLDRARMRVDSDRDAAHRYARAAILLAAQESAINGTLDLGSTLDKKEIDRLAGLTARESTRIRRAVYDHRVILRAARQQQRRVVYALSVLWAHKAGTEKIDEDDAEELRQHVVDGVLSIRRISEGRPDMQWVVANLCWMARAALDEADSKVLLDQIGEPRSKTGSRHPDRWLVDAREERPLVRIPPAHERLTVDVARAVHRRAQAGAKVATQPSH